MRHTEARPSQEDTPPSLRLGYLLSQYPARSHTFFLNEILGLRARGLGIETASINPPDRARTDLPAQESVEASHTFYVKEVSRTHALVAICGTAVKQPSVLARGLRAVWRAPSLSLRQRAFWLFYLAEAILVGRWMRERGLSHLHVHFGGAVATVGMLASIAWRIPYSLTIHGPEELLDPNGYQLPAKLSQASFVLCISDFCREELRRITPPAEWSKFAVIRLGVDPLLLAPQPTPPRDVRPGLTLVCVGRLVQEKGHRILLHALHLLRARGVELHAVLIGTGPLYAELQRTVEAQGLNDLVTFTSGLSHAETLAHVRNADIFALASFAEGVPVALMEAMSLGVPCVSTTIAGIPELICPGADGLLVPPGEPAAFADALETLARDESLRDRLGSAGRQRVIDEYNLPLNLERLAHHFRECLAERKPQRQA